MEIIADLCPATVGEDHRCGKFDSHHGDHECSCGCTWENSDG